MVRRQPCRKSHPCPSGAMFSRSSNGKIAECQKIKNTEVEKSRLAEDETSKIDGGEKCKIAEVEKNRIAEVEKIKVVNGEKNTIVEGEKFKVAKGEKGNIAEHEKSNIVEDEKSIIAEGEKSKIAKGEKSAVAEGEPQNIVSIHIFPAKLSSNPSDDDLSTLVITESGDVFGKGLNSLVGFYHNSPLPMKEGAGRKLKAFAKVEILSGLRMNKIRVGVGFGVGLTEGNELYMWGEGPQTLRLVSPNSAQIFLEYREGKCYCGLDHKLRCKKYADADLTDCIVYGLNCSYDSNVGAFAALPFLPDTPVRVYARYGDDASDDTDEEAPPIEELDCDQCGGLCGGLLIGKYYVNHCEKCDKLQEVSFDVPRSSKEMSVPRRVLSDVVDVDCGASFLCYLTSNKQLWILRWRRTPSNRTTLVYESPVQLPAYETVSSFSCGKAHIAVIMNNGELYIYGQGYSERISVGENALQPVILKRSHYGLGPVKKVFCGGDTTLCLLDDSSVWLVRKDAQQIIHTVSQSLNFDRKFFTDIICCVNMTDNFFLEENSSVWSVRRDSYQKIEVSRCENADIALFMAHKLRKSTASAEHHEKIEVVQVQLDNDGQPAKKKLKLEIPSNATPAERAHQPGLYGKTLLSDLTLKLADGEFPAHRQLLFTASNYFRKLFTTNAATVLDMSSFNARAYKTLLQYFYSEKPDDIGLEDLIDLYALATTYGEISIARIVSHQLNLLVNVDTVLPILAKAKVHDDKALLQKCNIVLRTPAYHEKMLESILQDPSKFIH